MPYKRAFPNVQLSSPSQRRITIADNRPATASMSASACYHELTLSFPSARRGKGVRCSRQSVRVADPCVVHATQAAT
jgi:hypothetical protein